jgi:N-carbamoyl-L-amino-acid hydrolase
VTTNSTITFSSQHFWNDFLAFSTIGALPEGGVERPFGSLEDLQARAWLIQKCEEIGLNTNIDPIGNLWGTLPGHDQLPLLAIGSHHDSVPQGGRFDGALGVLVGLEILRALKEAGYQNRHPLAMVSFTAEEPNPFDLSTMGSRTVAGRLSAEQLLSSKAWDGRSLQDAIQAVGGELSQIAKAHITAKELSAFLELHIEQGKRLERSHQPVAVVTGICGIYRLEVTVIGEANHAGTTMLVDRHDALLAASEMALAFEQLLIEQHHDDLVGTIGRFEISPNAANIIPGTAHFITEIRASNQPLIHQVATLFKQQIHTIAHRRGVHLEVKLVLDQAPAVLDEYLIHTLESIAARLQIPYERLFSMAGHDATHISSFTKAGMLFVPSIGGKSHCQEEESRLEDIELAGQILIQTIIELDQSLDQN